MKYNNLGKTDIKVSAICLGTMTFGEQNTEAEGHLQLDYAKDHGVNFIDTAELYAVPSRVETQGKTEEIIGTWLHDRKCRDQVIIGTKITGPSANLNYIRNGLDFSQEQLTLALEGSLERLQTDYIDLYQLHWPERKTNMFGQRAYKHNENDPWTDNFLEVLECLKRFQDEGKIRHIGVSNETPWGLHRFLKLSDEHNLPRMSSIQNPYNLLNRLFEVGLAEMSIKEDVGLLAYSPLGFGLLSGKYHLGKAGEDARLKLFDKHFTRYQSENCFKSTEQYIQIASEYNLDPAQMALAFINSRPFICSNIIGATNLDQLKSNIESIDVVVPPEAYKAIEAVHEAIPNPAP